MRNFSLAFLVGAMLATSAQAQLHMPGDSLAARLLRFDRDGNGRIDPHELPAKNESTQHERLPAAGLPLICDAQVYGPGGSGGAVASQQASESEQPQAHAANHRQPQRADQPHPHDRADGEVEESQPHDRRSAVEGGYPVVAEPSEQPEPRPRSVGLNKAVQYRLLLNRQQAQPRPQRYRQAATFGAVQGLVKQNRYRPVPDSCCAPTRSSFTLTIYSRYR